jgi:hypothetical protein
LDLPLAHTTRTTQQFLIEFWTPENWLPYSPDFTGLLFLEHFAGESSAMPHANLAACHPSIATEWDQLVAEYITRPVVYSAAV